MIEFYKATNKNNNNEYKLAYEKIDGDFADGKLGVIFMGGFKSDMEGTKALYLRDLCKEQNISYIRFDYFGHGKSDGDFADGTIGGWLEDSLQIIDNMGIEKYIIIGSSMGGWLMLLAALVRPQKIHALIGIAAAPDFTGDLMWENMTYGQRETLLKKGLVMIDNDYGDPYPITRELIKESRKHRLLIKPIAINCSVRLLHGEDDEDVPWQRSAKLLKQLRSKDTKFTLAKGVGHSMSDKESLELIKNNLLEILPNRV